MAQPQQQQHHHQQLLPQQQHQQQQQQQQQYATSPTLYEKCLHSYVLNLNYNVKTLDQIQYLRYLPQNVLIDIYIKMSKCTFLHDMLFEQLADLEVFERLLRFNPARLKLFRCLSELMSNNKPLAEQLQRNFTARYPIPKKPTLQAANTKRSITKFKPKINLINTKIDFSNALTSEAITTATMNIAIKPQQSPSSATTTTTTPATATAAKTLIGITKNHSNVELDKSTSNIESATSNENTTALLNHPQMQQNPQCLGVININSIVDVDYDVEEADEDDVILGMEEIDFGLRLGSFLTEAGWLSESIKVFHCVAAHLERFHEPILSDKMVLVRLDCLQRLLHSEQALGSFKSAERTFDQINTLLDKLQKEDVPSCLLANIYTQFSAMYFARSEYDDSHMWSVVAMRELKEDTPKRITVDVLRQAAKACVVKRDFHRANLLICQAMQKASEIFGKRHQKYADALLGYGFFLLNVDSVYQSVKVYKEALDIKRTIFGNRNFHVAVAHEDLAYAYYVHEYSTGNFSYARENVENAIDIMQDLVPNDHLLLASAKRVKALLLEEIALDKMAEGVDEEGLLKQSEELHKSALRLSLEAFGEVNVQTAKHYGNLGRLYQTMQRFEEAESMHQKAIKIKTELLGPQDYEVGLSIGHLASLYNYQMKRYREAEDLYLRSIEISLRLFGRSYSGLEYDYLGLCHVYETLREFEKYLKYATILENWQVLRGQNLTMNKSIYPPILEDCSLEDIKFKFFNMNTNNLTACN